MDTDVDQMRADACAARQDRPLVEVCRKRPEKVLADWVRQLHDSFTQGLHQVTDPGPMGPQVHADGTGHSH